MEKIYCDLPTNLILLGLRIGSFRIIRLEKTIEKNVQLGNDPENNRAKEARLNENRAWEDGAKEARLKGKSPMGRSPVGNRPGGKGGTKR